MGSTLVVNRIHLFQLLLATVVSNALQHKLFIKIKNKKYPNFHVVILRLAKYVIYITPHITKQNSEVDFNLSQLQVVILQLANYVIFPSWYFNTEKKKGRTTEKKKKKGREEPHSLALALTVTVTLGPKHSATSHC